jgi:hypothetical protein
MKRFHEYLRIFSLGLAGLVFLAHMIIPHDHHGADAYQEKDFSCTEKGDKPITDHGFPSHCHAFNELLPEKILKLVNFERALTADSAFTGPDITKLQIDDEPVQLIFVSEHLVFCNPEAATVSLRAPPVI